MTLTDDRLTKPSYILQPTVSKTRKVDSELFFLILVHSHPVNFKRRQIIRETWASVSKIQGRKVKVVFLIGNSSYPHQTTNRYQNQENEDRTIQEPKSLDFDNLLSNYNIPHTTNFIESYERWIGKYIAIPKFSNRIGKAQNTIEDTRNKNENNELSENKSSLGTKNDIQNDQDLQNKIVNEHLVFGDIVQGNFIDSEENSVAKHLFGLKVKIPFHP